MIFETIENAVAARAASCENGFKALHRNVLIAVSLSHLILVAVFVAVLAQALGAGNLAEFVSRWPKILQNTENAKQGNENRVKPPLSNSLVVQSALQAPTEENTQNAAKTQTQPSKKAVWRIQFWRKPAVARQTPAPKIEREAAQVAQTVKPPQNLEENESENSPQNAEKPALPPLPVLSNAPDYLAAPLAGVAPLAGAEDLEIPASLDESPEDTPPAKGSLPLEGTPLAETTVALAPPEPPARGATPARGAGAASTAAQALGAQNLEPSPVTLDVPQNVVEPNIPPEHTEDGGPEPGERKYGELAPGKRLLPDISPIPLQNGGQLNWQFSWQEPSPRRLRYLPSLQFPVELLQGMEDQTVEIVFQVDRQGRVVSASFEQLRAQNWEIGSLLLEAVRQFEFETTSRPLAEESPDWLSRGRMSFHFITANAAPKKPD